MRCRRGDDSDLGMMDGCERGPSFSISGPLLQEKPWKKPGVFSGLLKLSPKNGPTEGGLDDRLRGLDLFDQALKAWGGRNVQQAKAIKKPRELTSSKHLNSSFFWDEHLETDGKTQVFNGFHCFHSKHDF